MALSINTNVAALNSYRNLSNTQNDLSKSLEKLSSGLRINRAADDAAGLAISEGMRAQIGGTKQAVRNAQDGISVVQTAEGALTETHSILQRMRTLSVQASNEGGLNDAAKGNIQDEMNQLKTELTRIADTTKFNGQALLDGTYNGTFQVGANTSAADKISVNLKGGSMGTVGLGLAGVDVKGLASDGSTAVSVNATSGVAGTSTVTAKTDAGLAATLTADTSLKNLNGTISLGGKSFDLSSVAYSKSDTAGAGTADLGKIQAGLDEAFGASKVTAAISGGAVVFTGPTVTGSAAEVAAAQPTFTAKSGATQAIDLIDKAITTVSKTRSQLGAVQNRFDHTINNLNVAAENLSASESRIRDTDMASEMVSFTRSQILSQAGTAMLAQAKSIPQGVLQLLQ